MQLAPAPTLLDRLIGWLSPRSGLARHIDRLRLARAYEAASPRDGWKVRRAGASPAADHQADAKAIRERARALVQNVPYVRAGMEAYVAQAVGTGISTFSTAASQTVRKTLDRTYAAWSKVCDADGRLPLGGLVAAAVRARRQDGECLIRLRRRTTGDGLPVPLQLQLLEIDWLDTQRTGGALGSNQIINGIEYDALGRPAAYWLFDQHPGDALRRPGLRVQSRRISAADVIHVYNPERPGQGRGISSLAPVIVRVRDLQLYEDAELARKNLETRLSVLVSGDPAALATPPAPGESANPAATGDLGPLASGGITSVPPGMNITTVEPKAAEGYTDYVKQQLHLIASGMGVTYEMLTGDMREVNYSSARVRMLDFRRQVETDQWLQIVPQICEPIWRAFVDAAELANLVPRADYACDYSTPKWDYVDPQKDAEAELALVHNGLSSYSEILRRRGYKPDEVFAELAEDVKKLRELDLLDLLLTWSGKAAPPVQPADGAARVQAREAVEAARRATDPALLQLLERLTARATEPAPPPAAPSVVHVHPPAQEIRVGGPTVNVESPAVDVHVQPTPVHVAPAEVRVDAHVTVPEQPAPAVHVNPVVNVTTPRRRIDGIVEHDERTGRVIRTTSIETDLPDEPSGGA